MSSAELGRGVRAGDAGGWFGDYGITVLCTRPVGVVDRLGTADVRDASSVPETPRVRARTSGQKHAEEWSDVHCSASKWKRSREGSMEPSEKPGRVLGNWGGAGMGRANVKPVILAPLVTNVDSWCAPTVVQ